MKTKIQILSFFSMFCLLFFLTGCDEGTWGANPYDPNTPATVSEWPEITSFDPISGQAGDEITIIGKNFSTAVSVTFGGQEAESFTIVNDNTIVAVLGPYGASGAVTVTNHKGEKSLSGFVYIWPVEDTETPNLALSGTATASEAFSGFYATNVNDGQMTTAWVSANNNIGEDRWVMIDLGELTEINMVVLFWDPQAAGTDYILEVSEDGSVFTTIAQETGWLSNGDDAGEKTITFETITVRYVRLNNLYNSITSYNMTLWEFEIYNMPAPSNLAKGMPVEADCDLYGYVNNITDGSITTMWQSEDETHDHWIMVSFVEAVTMNNIVISFDGGAYPQTVELRLSEDGETYNQIYTVTSWSPTIEPRTEGDSVWTKAVLDVSFEDTEAKYIRVDFGDPSSVWNIGIFELEVYNQW